jgi:[ribosomal protein S18]-alanine N-acetyltransferase
MIEPIQRATQAHAAALAAIHAAAFPVAESWGEDAISLQLALPGTFGSLDTRGGMLLARVARDDVEVLTLAVTPGARRQGIATRLMHAATAEACACGAAVLFLEVATTNTGARALYRRAGLVEVGRRRRYYPDGSDAIVLRLNLL